MNSPEVRQWRTVSNDTFLRVTPDHLKIAGSNTAALTYAAIEWRAAGERVEISIPEIIKAQGVLAQERKKVMAAMGALFARGVLTRCEKPGRDRRYAFLINWLRVNELLLDGPGMDDRQQPESVLSGSPKRDHQQSETGPPDGPKRDHPPIKNNYKNYQEPTQSEPTKPTELGGWGSELEDRIRKLLQGTNGMFRDRWSEQTVRNLAKELCGPHEAWLVGCLDDELRLIARGRPSGPNTYGGVIARARSWKHQVPVPVEPVVEEPVVPELGGRTPEQLEAAYAEVAATQAEMRRLGDEYWLRIPKKPVRSAERVPAEKARNGT